MDQRLFVIFDNIYYIDDTSTNKTISVYPGTLYKIEFFTFDDFNIIIGDKIIHNVMSFDDLSKIVRFVYIDPESPRTNISKFRMNCTSGNFPIYYNVKFYKGYDWDKEMQLGRNYTMYTQAASILTKEFVSDEAEETAKNNKEHEYKQISNFENVLRVKCAETDESISVTCSDPQIITKDLFKRIANYFAIANSSKDDFVVIKCNLFDNVIYRNRQPHLPKNIKYIDVEYGRGESISVITSDIFYLQY